VSTAANFDQPGLSSVTALSLYACSSGREALGSDTGEWQCAANNDLTHWMVRATRSHKIVCAEL
jgi:hypothetical protein